MNLSADAVLEHIIKSPNSWLCLDYDGTLADFEPTPDIIRPDTALENMLNDLVRCPGIFVAVISGRRLDDLRSLLPVPGLWLAGIYGVEWQTPGGEKVISLDVAGIRPELDAIKEKWKTLIGEESSFYLEDKGLALALHARHVEDQEANEVLISARQVIDSLFELPVPLQVLEGHKFLEVAPKRADKGQAVSYLLEKNPKPEALLVYVGDDDRDERAFRVVRDRGGIAVLVADTPRPSVANCRLESPAHVRRWLKQIVIEFPSARH
jgi:trehalose-phosphatase